MRLGIPFDTYIVLFETSVWSSVIAMQTDRVARRSWYGMATIRTQHGLWAIYGLLGTLAWPALIILAFLQFYWLTALGWLALGAITAAVVPAALGLYRRNPEVLIIWNRICLTVALVLTVFLWWQAVTAHR